MRTTLKPVRPFGVANDLQIKMVTRTNVSYAQIAKQTGMTKTAIRRAVRAGLERQREQRREMEGRLFYGSLNSGR